MSTDGHIVGMVFLNDVIELIKSKFDPQKFVGDLQKSVSPILARLVDEKFIEIMTKMQKEFDPDVFLGEITQHAMPLVEELVTDRLNRLEHKLQDQIQELIQDLSKRIRL